jgi:hypothetical protein
MAESLFDYLSPKQKVKVPYRAPEGVPNGELSQSLQTRAPADSEYVKVTEPMKVGEEKVLKTKPSGIEMTVKQKQAGVDPSVIKQKLPEFEQINIYGERPSPDIVDDQPLPSVIQEPFEKRIKSKIEGQPVVEAKNIRNAEVLKEQKETTSNLAPERSEWDDIWPALLPVAVNALIGDDTTDVAWDEASKAIGNIQKMRFEERKLAAKGAKGDKQHRDYMAEIEARIQGQKEIREMIGNQSQQLALTNQILDIGKKREELGLKATYDKELEDFKSGAKTIEAYVKNPETGKEEIRTLPMSEYLFYPNGERIPIEKRLKIPKAGMGSQRLSETKVTNTETGITTVIKEDPFTGQAVSRQEYDTGGNVFPGLSIEQYNSLAKDTVKDFEKTIGNELDKQRSLAFHYKNFLEKNNIATLGSLVDMARVMGQKGTLTEGDYQRFSGPVSTLKEYYDTLVKNKTNLVPADTRAMAAELARNMIEAGTSATKSIRGHYVRTLEAKTSGKKGIKPGQWEEFLYQAVPDVRGYEELKAKESEMKKTKKLGRYGRKQYEKETRDARIKELEEKASR